MCLKEQELDRANALVAAAHQSAILDTGRPRLHFASPCHRLIDVWGGIWHEGYYHLFYDLNYDNHPEKLNGAFGHLRSLDLVRWEDLGLCLLPEEERGESVLNDGTVVIDPQGRPLMYYTRCFYDMTRNREQVAVRGSADLVRWGRLNGGDAILTMENHGGPVFHMSWSDPIIFTEAGRTFMIISKCTVDGKGMIPIYEATDDTWLNWEYKGAFADHTGEVLNFIKIKDKWVLIYSPYQNPRYFIGHFDLDTCRFVEERRGALSYGYIAQGHIEQKISRGFYATTAFHGEDGMAYIMGWISGFHDPKGWDGAVSLPRVLDIDEDGELRMRPAPALDALRQERIEGRNGNVTGIGRCFEWNVDLTLDKEQKAVLEMKDSFTLTITRDEILFNDIRMPYQTAADGRIRLRMYIDVTVAEIFVDDGRASISRCFSELSEDAALCIQADGAWHECYGYPLRRIYGT